MRPSSSPNSPADISQLIDQLERHCLSSDGSYVSKSAFSELHLVAREEMFKERLRYLEALAVYEEAVAMVEEYHQAISATGHGGVRDQSLFPHFQLTCFSQAYESLEHQLVVAEAAQRSRLPLLSKDGDINVDEIDKWNAMPNSAFDSANISGLGGPYSSIFHNILLGVGGVPNRFLGITPSYLSQVQLHQASISANMAEYQSSIILEIESRLEAKCDALADIFTMDDIDSSSMSHISGTRLPERVKLITEEIEREEALFLEDLYSMDRKFAEHFNVLDQILEVLIKFVKDLKLKHQHKLDEMRKDWLCKRCQAMSAKLRVLEHILLRDTYTKESVPALHRIRNYLLEATEEVSVAYNKAVTRLREYQGVDPHFDSIAKQYHDIVKKLEGMQWAIHQVEMDLNHPFHQSPT